MRLSSRSITEPDLMGIVNEGDLDIVTSLREVHDIVTSPDLFHSVTNCLSIDEYTPNPNGIYFRAGGGLVWYEPRGYALELFSAVRKSPESAIKGIHKQWDYLSKLGYYSVYAMVQKHNLKSAIMCRACGMKKTKNNDVNVYEKVIYGR